MTSQLDAIGRAELHSEIILIATGTAQKFTADNGIFHSGLQLPRWEKRPSEAMSPTHALIVPRKTRRRLWPIVAKTIGRLVEEIMLLGLMAAALAVGLIWCLTCVAPAEVNHGYFRSSLLVVLGLSAFAVLAGWSETPRWISYCRIAIAGLSYVAFFCWSIERTEAGRWLLRFASALGLAAIFSTSTSPQDLGSVLIAWGSTISGAAVLGFTMGAMLLGHYYLTAPWMSLKPINRLLAAIFAITVVRAGFLGQEALDMRSQPNPLSGLEWGIYVALRWGAGVIGILGMATMSVRTLRLNATQAATGILYVVVIFAMVGETTGVVFQAMTRSRPAVAEASS